MQLEKELIKEYNDDQNYQNGPVLIPLIKEVIQLKEQVYKGQFFPQWQGNREVYMNYLYNYGQLQEARKQAELIRNNIPTQTEEEIVQKLKFLVNYSALERTFAQSELCQQILVDGDIIVAKYKETKNVQILEQIAYFFAEKARSSFYNQQVEEQIQYFQKSIDIFGDLLDMNKNQQAQEVYNLTIAKLFAEVGKYMQEIGGYEQAYNLFEESLKYWQKIDHGCISLEHLETIYFKSELLVQQHWFDEAEKQLKDVVEKVTKKFTPNEAEFLINVHILLNELYQRKNDKQNMEIQMKCIDKLKLENKDFLLPTVQTKIILAKGVNYKIQNDLKTAMLLFEQGIKLIENGNREEIEPLYPKFCYQKGLIQATQGQFFNPEKALETYEKLIYLSQLEGGPYYDLEADAKRIKGQVLIEKKQFKKGINVLFEALQIYYEMGLQFTQQFMEVYQYLEDVSFNFRSLTQEQQQIIQECQQIYQSLKKGNAA